MFADVIIDIQHEKLDKIFQYRIPERLEHEVEAGMAVVVPFGKGNRKTKGYVTALSKTCDYDISKVKEIADISRSGVEIEAKLIALAAWMKSNYGGTMLQSLKTVLPIKEKENIKVSFSTSSSRSVTVKRERLKKVLQKKVYFRGFVCRTTRCSGALPKLRT